MKLEGRNNRSLAVMFLSDCLIFQLLHTKSLHASLLYRQGDSLEQLKALLQQDEAVGAGPDVRPTPTAPPPSPPFASSPTPSQAYGYEGYQGGDDDGAAAGMRVKLDGSVAHRGGKDGPVRVSGGGVHQTTNERRSAPPPTAQKRTQRGGSKGTMRRLSSSTSYKASRVYDRDYGSDEFYGDAASDRVEKEEVKAKIVVPHLQEIVTVPCDLAEAGSAVEVMKELKRLGIDDKVHNTIPYHMHDHQLSSTRSCCSGLLLLISISCCCTSEGSFLSQQRTPLLCACVCVCLCVCACVRMLLSCFVPYSIDSALVHFLLKLSS